MCASIADLDARILQTTSGQSISVPVSLALDATSYAEVNNAITADFHGQHPALLKLSPLFLHVEMCIPNSIGLTPKNVAKLRFGSRGVDQNSRKNHACVSSLEAGTLFYISLILITERGWLYPLFSHRENCGMRCCFAKKIEFTTNHPRKYQGTVRTCVGHPTQGGGGFATPLNSNQSLWPHTSLNSLKTPQIECV